MKVSIHPSLDIGFFLFLNKQGSIDRISTSATCRVSEPTVLFTSTVSIAIALQDGILPAVNPLIIVDGLNASIPENIPGIRPRNDVILPPPRLSEINGIFHIGILLI